MAIQDHSQSRGEKQEWQNRNRRIDSQGERLLNRCLVVSLEADCKEKPTLEDKRRWSNLGWKNTFGVNMYLTYGDKFLLKFPNNQMAEQVLQSQWS